MTAELGHVTSRSSGLPCEVSAENRGTNSEDEKTPNTAN